MLNAIKQILGLGPKVKFAQLKKDGAIIIDVRSKDEYASGHLKGSINIPLQQLQNNLSKIKKGKPVITCCASGMRSAQAKNLLKSQGYQEVHNGGGWSSLKARLNN